MDIGAKHDTNGALAAPHNNTFNIQNLNISDLADLESFYNAFHARRARLLDMEVWRWEFTRSPRQPDKLPFLIIRTAAGIHGGIGMIPLLVDVGTESVEACFPANFFIDPAYRGLPALRLMKAMLSQYPLVIASYISADSYKLFKAARFVDLGPHLKDYFYTLRPGETAPRTLRNRLKTVLFIGARRAWLVVVRRYASMRCSQHTSIHIGQCLEDRFIPDQSDFNSHNRIAIRKDIAYLHWRYQQSPALNCTFITLLAEDQPAMLAVVHYDSGANISVLLDIIGSSHDMNKVLLLLAAVIRQSIGQGAYLLKTTLLDAGLTKALTMLGFSSQKSDHGLMVYCHDKGLADRLTRIEDWHFVLGDSDVY